MLASPKKLTQRPASAITFQHQRIVGEQARDHQRQRGVLRAGNGIVP